jgi:thioredoxin reductase (NADPH)
VIVIPTARKLTGQKVCALACGIRNSANETRRLEQRKRQILALRFAGGKRVEIDNIFTTRGDVFHTGLAKSLGARLDQEGQIVVDRCMRTSVPRLYAAGCVTPANCQMIIAAGEGAAAAQAINRDLFEESLKNHSLRRFREMQLEKGRTVPEEG